MNRHILILFLLMIIMYMSACTDNALKTVDAFVQDIYPAHIFPNQDDFLRDEDGKAYIPYQQALEDYNYMWQKLKEVAPFWPEIESSPHYKSNLTLETQEEYMRMQLAEMYAGSSLSINEYNNFFMHSLGEIANIGHIVPIGQSYFFDMLLLAYEDTMLNGYEDHPLNLKLIYSNLFSLTSNRKTIAYYDNLRNPDDAYTDTDTAQDLSEEEKARRISTYYRNSITTDYRSGIPYIIIKNFMYPSVDLLGDYMAYIDDNLRPFLLENKDAEHLIIDIRGNGGGSSAMWEWVILPLLMDRDYVSYRLQGINHTAHNQWLFNNHYIMDESKMDDSWRGHFANIDEQRFDVLVGHTFTYSFSEEDYTGFGGKVWLLVDGHSYSAAESVAIFCKQTGFATIVGSQTKGGGGSIDPWVFALPNSGMLIFYEGIYAYNVDGTSNQIVGTMPDIVVTGENALAACLNEIREE